MANPETLLPPGFRFHPTDEELIQYYLRNQATSLPCPVSIIAEVDIYKFDPWELPAKAMFGDKEWYFFSPRDRKYPNGVRPNRAAASGYWKATGTDKPIVAGGGGGGAAAARKESIGVKKALVFYQGRPPKGIKTDWIMHEYRLADGAGGRHHGGFKRPRDSSMRLDDWVLCRIYKKSNNQHPSSPSDRDQEVSTVDDTYFPPSHAGGGGHLPKNASLSDLFDDADFSVLTRLLNENPSNMGDPELDQSFNCGGIFSLLTAEESPPKRPRTAEEQAAPDGGGAAAAAFDRYDGHYTGDGEGPPPLPCNHQKLLKLSPGASSMRSGRSPQWEYELGNF